MNSLYLKFSSVFFCFILSLCLLKKSYDIKDGYILLGAMGFTLISDFFILILNKNEIGVFCFIIVQLFYIYRYSGYKYYNYISAFVFLEIIISLFINLRLLYVLSVIYASCFLFSLISAVNVFKGNLFPSPAKHFIMIGMVLFCLCDINVAILNLNIPYSLNNHHTIEIIIWLFYFPSQLLLAISSADFVLLETDIKKRKRSII